MARGRLGAVRLSRMTAVALLALLGVVCAAGITYAASRLVRQPIGLSAEPRELSTSLAAPSATTPSTTTRVTTPSRTTTTPAPAGTVTVPGEHPGGHGDGDADDD